MDSERTVKNPYIQIVDDHLESGDPPATRAAIDQLLGKGRSPVEARQLVAAVVRIEMEAMMSANRPFDSEKYAAGLNKMVASEK